ncbi:hypothetical protein FRB91_004975 [Serendipita sp. 411]|nr:hypothetical protein FRB91_004975 [Serendipita sp. 411]
MNRPLRHTTKQLRWIVLGGALTWYTDVVRHLRELLQSPSSPAAPETLKTWQWNRLSGLASVGLGAMTVVLFLYLLLLPRFSGRRLNVRLCSRLESRIVDLIQKYAQWRQSEELRVVIPILTVTIFVGWSTLLFTLYASSLQGFLMSLLGASGLYTLSFGLLGLIPSVGV